MLLGFTQLGEEVSMSKPLVACRAIPHRKSFLCLKGVVVNARLPFLHEIVRIFHIRKCLFQLLELLLELSVVCFEVSKVSSGVDLSLGKFL